MQATSPMSQSDLASSRREVFSLALGGPSLSICSFHAAMMRDLIELKCSLEYLPAFFR
jgi:hypothetical protein